MRQRLKQWCPCRSQIHFGAASISICSDECKLGVDGRPESWPGTCSQGFLTEDWFSLKSNPTRTDNGTFPTHSLNRLFFDDDRACLQ
jgi:hypothetical protein